MPQVFQVLRCYKCLVFQVHQTKKANKFQCKVCGEKQSIKRHYGIGNGQECRSHVQKLNSMRGEIDEIKTQNLNNSSDTDEEEINSFRQTINFKNEKHQSKWSEFVETDDKIAIDDKTDDKTYLGDAEVVLELPNRKRPKKINTIKNSRLSKPCRKNSYFDENEYLDESEKEDSLKVSQTCMSPKSPKVNFKHTGFKNPIIKTENMLQQKTDQISLNSKWSNFEDCKEDLSNVEELKSCDIVPYKNKKESDIQSGDVQIKSQFVPLAVNKNSKWTKFTENTENKVETEIEQFELKTHKLFSLCDDSELDNYLDI